MPTDTSANPSGIRGRDHEIQQITSFITSRIQNKKSGTLYVTGPPGTGKTMSINYALDQIKGISIFSLNCLKVQTAKQILVRLCRAAKLDEFVKCNENEMLARLTKKFTGRASSSQIILLDEVDQVPKSKNVELIKTIFSWPQQPNSKLILIGIANIVNLTSRCAATSLISGQNLNQITRIVFRPYTSKDIKDILQWYLDNDENFEEASLDQKALELISKRYAKENGDIRGALNALKSAIDDTNEQQLNVLATTRNQSDEQNDTSLYPTPPTTPPLSPCKDRTTNIASVANSVKKRQKNYDFQDSFPFTYQVMMLCIQKLYQISVNSGVDIRGCKNLATSVLEQFKILPTTDEFRSILDNLEIQGLINFKKSRNCVKVHLKATENEILQLVVRRDMINHVLNKLV